MCENDSAMCKEAVICGVYCHKEKMNTEEEESNLGTRIPCNACEGASQYEGHKEPEMGGDVVEQASHTSHIYKTRRMRRVSRKRAGRKV